MSQRSQVAKRGSRPIEQCSAACADPGRSIAGQPGRVEGAVGDGPPDPGGAQGALGEVERLLAEHLAAGLAPHLEGDDLVGDVDLAEREPAVAPVAVVPLSDDRDVGGLACGGGVGRVRAADHRDVLLEVERLDQPGLAAVHVDRPGVGGRVRAAGVDRADHPAGPGLDQRHRRARRPSGCRRGRWPAAGRSRTSRASGAAAARPGSAGRPRRGRSARTSAGPSSVRGSSAAAAHRCGPRT